MALSAPLLKFIIKLRPYSFLHSGAQLYIKSRILQKFSLQGMQKALQILAQVGKLLLRAAGRITAEFAIT